MIIENSPISLLTLISIIFVSILGFRRQSNILMKYSLHPYSVVNFGKYYQLITHIFLHLDFMHLLFNGLTFYFFAPYLEQTLGSGFLIILFVSSGLVSSIPSILKHKNNPDYYSLGASGAISGIVFSYILFYPTSRIYIFLLPIGIPAPIFGLIYLGYCIYASKYQYTNINHDAHFWGAIWGIILSIILYPEVIPFFIERLKSI